MNETETPRSIIKTTLIAVALTTVAVVVIQVAVRLITGKALGGVAVSVGVPVAFVLLWTLGIFRRRKSG
jgi:hypothetical protein